MLEAASRVDNLNLEPVLVQINQKLDWPLSVQDGVVDQLANEQFRPVQLLGLQLVADPSREQAPSLGRCLNPPG